MCRKKHDAILRRTDRIVSIVPFSHGNQQTAKQPEGIFAASAESPANPDWLAERGGSNPDTDFSISPSCIAVSVRPAGASGIRSPRWGLDDETVLKANPRLVITHVSGYGQYGAPGYPLRTSYDIVGQAFGGTMYQTGYPG